MSKQAKARSNKAAHQNGGTTYVCAAVLAMHNNFKLYHWAASSYSRHVATDELIDALGKHGDRLVEALVASRESRPSLSAMETEGDPISDEARPGEGAKEEELDRWASRYIAACIRFWTASDAASPAACAMQSDVGVRSIADEIVAALRKAQYLFSFR